MAETWTIMSDTAAPKSDIEKFLGHIVLSMWPVHILQSNQQAEKSQPVALLFDEIFGAIGFHQRTTVVL